MAAKKARQTFEKLRREQDRKRRREEKAEKKEQRRLEKAGLLTEEPVAVPDDE